MIEPSRTNGRFDSPGGDAQETLSVGTLLRMVRRHRRLFLAVFAGCVVVAALISVLTPPLWSSDVFLRIDDRDSRDMLLADIPSLPGMKQGEIETEIMVLRSRELAESVVDSLALRVVLKEPRRPRDHLVEVRAAGASALEATIELSATRTAGEYSVDVDSRQRLRDVPATVRTGMPFTIGDVQLALRPAPGGDAPDRIVIEILPYREAVRNLRENLQVVRPDHQAKIVKLAYASNDSVLVAEVPNALARAFITYKRYTTHTEERSTVQFLESQVGMYTGQLAQAEEELRVFRERRQVVSLHDQATEQVKQLAQYQTERNALVQERDGLARLLQQVERSAEDGSTSPYRQIASFPSLFSNRAVQDMLLALNDLENERAKAALGRTITNADVQLFDARISAIEAQLHQLTRSYVANLDNQIADTEAMLRRFGVQLDQVPAVEMEFARLAREQKLLEEIYTLLLTRLKEAEVKAAVEPGDVRIIDTALVPDEPIAPRPFRNMLLGTLVGLVLATSSVYVRERSNTAVQSRDDVRQLAGTTPVVGYIPHMQAAGGNGVPSWRMPWQRPAVGDGRTLLAALLQDNAATEAFRSLRTNLQFVARTTRTPALLITSSIPGEGKSTTAVNLAMTLAREGRRILLIDADLRRGHVHTGLGLPKTPGLAQVIIGEMSTAEAVHRIDGAEGTQLDVLTAGGYPPNAAELLSSDAMTELLEDARTAYDTIILDAPPVAAVTDAAVLSRISDATLLVVRSGLTPKAAMEYTMSQLLHVGAPLKGVVINDIDRDRDSGYYAYSYYDYEKAGK